MCFFFGGGEGHPNICGGKKYGDIFLAMEFL